MALQLKYTDEHGILHINMTPSGTPDPADPDKPDPNLTDPHLTDPKFDTINNRFGNYDLFGGKYACDGGDTQSLFRSRYNSIEEELANTPYAFATERSLRLSASPLLDITIKTRDLVDDVSPSKDLEDDRFFRAVDGLFGPQLGFQTTVKTSDEEDSPAFTVTQLIHAQDRYFDLSSRQSSVFDSPSVSDKGTKVNLRNLVVKSEPSSAKARTVKIDDAAFKVLASVPTVKSSPGVSTHAPLVSPPKWKREKSFAIVADTIASRPSSPRSLPVEIRPGRVSPLKGRGFREETSRHPAPKTSAPTSRASSPPRRTNSLPRIDKMAAATLPPPIPPILARPHSPRNFLKENMEEVRELSELNREKHEAEADRKKLEEEEALLIEMGLLDKNDKSEAIRSVVCSRTTSRSNSPGKIKLRSRSNSPSAIAPTAIHFDNVPADRERFINLDDGMPRAVTHNSRVRTVTKSQPQSNDGSPKHSKIPKRQNSVSPTRSNKREASASRKPSENGLGKNQRFISNSTSSIHETIKIGGPVGDKRGISKSTQLLNISPAHIKGKPPISPGRAGPPPSNKYINSKRLSPIVGTPNKSPVEDPKPSSAKTTTKPSPAARKPIKTAGNTSATSRLNSRQPSRNVSRDPSPEKRRTVSKPPTNTRTANNTVSKPVARAASTRLPQKPTIPKTDPKKPINRTNSMKSLTRTPSTRNLNEKPPILTKRDSKRDLKVQSTSKIDEVGKKDTKDDKKSPTKSDKGKDTPGKASIKKEKVETKKGEIKKFSEAATSAEEVPKQDNETQYDKMSNGNGDLVILTKKNIVSMTTAAIMSQPLDVVTTVTNQLPAAFEKAREKGIFERHSSKDSLAPKKEDSEPVKNETTDVTKDKPKDVIKDISKATTKDTNKDTTKDANKETIKEITEEDKSDDKKAKSTKGVTETKTIFIEDNIKLKPLLPPYNNPQVERVKQKIDDLLRSPEVSTESILAAAAAAKAKETKSIKSIANVVKKDIKDSKDEVAAKLTNIKDQVVKQNEKTTAEIRSEASKIVDSIITPVEEPKEVKVEKPAEVKKDIEPIVMVVNEKKNVPDKNEITEKMTETLVKGEPEVEVQSSNMSSPRVEKITVQTKMADGNDSDKSAHSNGGFPQSTSTTPKPPARAHRRDQSKDSTNDSKETTPQSETPKPANICSRLMGKCKSKCCPCCIKPETDETKDVEAAVEGKRSVMSKLNCCKKKEKDVESEIERAAGKAASIQYESETKRKRKFRDVLCGCCGRRRRVSAVSEAAPRHIDDVSAPSHASDVTGPTIVGDTGCCGRKRSVERRDSILSDRQPTSGCNNRLFTWMRGACRRKQPEDMSASRRQSLFSKNKSLSPTLPPEDTRTKLDTSLVEHTSMMRGAIPILPIVLAFFCLLCNICVPGLGTIFSGMFCLCFGIPRFGVHDGAKHRIGSFVINLLVGCGQLFTVLFCLVGWGWSIWWGVIMVKTSRKYRKLKAEEAAAEAEAAPPVTANNHTRA